MRILNRYLLGDFMVVLLISLVVVTFVMSIGAIFGMLDLVTRGIPALSIGRILLFNLPYIMSFSIPISVLTSVLLQFSRMSMDGEITAMRACGISMWQISTPIVVTSIVLSFFCLYLNSFLAPEGHHARRKAVIDSVVVCERVRNQGIASAMIQWVKKTLADRGCSHAGVAARFSRYEAHHLYPKLEFEQFGYYFLHRM